MSSSGYWLGELQSLEPPPLAFVSWQKEESRQLLGSSSPSNDPSMLCRMKYMEVIDGSCQSRCVSQVGSKRGSFAHSWRAEVPIPAGSFQGTCHIVPATVVGRQVSELGTAMKPLYPTPTGLALAGLP